MARNGILLLSSLFFYFWGEGAYTAIMLIYIIGNYGFARAIEYFKQSANRILGLKRAKAFLVFAVTFDLSFLVYYKYVHFLLINLNPLFDRLAFPFQAGPVHLPIGISFFAFQSISYVVDVYRGEVKASPSLINFATYKSFFPQLIAGPIVRYRDVARQVVDRTVSLEQFSYGLKRFIVGLGKKVIVANSVAAVADEIFKIPSNDLTPAVAWLGILCYTLQIYYDFSGYSDMAIGMGRMFGFQFLENFNYPYISLSIREFWRRWHISLSTWFRDYLYKPLGGNRCGVGRVYFNLVLVFSLCGLWHGASWTFAIWGLWHGLFLLLERTSMGIWLEKSWLPIRSLYTLLVVAIGWVFFRSDSLTYALYYLLSAFGFARGDGVGYPIWAYLNRELMLLMILGILFATPLAPALGRLPGRFSASLGEVGPSAPPAKALLEACQSMGYLVMLIFCAMLLASGTHNPFIYFRF